MVMISLGGPEAAGRPSPPGHHRDRIRDQRAWTFWDRCPSSFPLLVSLSSLPQLPTSDFRPFLHQLAHIPYSVATVAAIYS